MVVDQNCAIYHRNILFLLQVFALPFLRQLEINYTSKYFKNTCLYLVIDKAFRKKKSDRLSLKILKGLPSHLWITVQYCQSVTINFSKSSKREGSFQNESIWPERIQPWNSLVQTLERPTSQECQR